MISFKDEVPPMQNYVLQEYKYLSRESAGQIMNENNELIDISV